MALHASLTGADLHESKGVAGAAADTVYVCNGAGSGTHKKITLASLDTTSIQNPNTYQLTGVITDVSAPSSILIPVPFASTIVSAYCVLGGAITVANSILTFTRQDGASLGSTLTITQVGSAEGTGFTFTATTNTSIAANGYIKIATDGGSTTTFPLYINVVLTRVP